MRSISRYIKCIRTLQLPYPAEGLRKFLSEYSANFTRRTTPDNIYFDGNQIIIEPMKTMMTADMIDNMLMGLVENHHPRSDIVERYKFASIQLSKRHDVVIMVPRTPNPTPVGIKSSMHSLEIDTMNNIIKRANRENDSFVPITFDIALNIIAVADVNWRHILKYPDEAVVFFGAVWSRYHNSNRELDNPHAIMHFLPGKNMEALIDDIVRRLEKTVKIRRAMINVPAKKIVYDNEIQQIQQAKREAIVADVKNPKIENNVKGMFNTLLFTHNTSLDVALMMFMGELDCIRGVNKTGNRIYPYGRGAQFRWGIDSQYGDVIFIMKPRFWDKYKKGIYENQTEPIIVDGVVFRDFWGDKQGHEADFESTMKRNALNFGFRESIIPQQKTCDDRDRDNLTWCNTQIHIGENVNLDDIDTVLIPRFIATSTIPFMESNVADILFRAQYEETYKVNDMVVKNPFYRKLVEYGPLIGEKGDGHSHYSINLKSHGRNRHKIYDSIFAEYSVYDDLVDTPRKDYNDTVLYRSYLGGNSSMIGLSKNAFIAAQEEYMYCLISHKMHSTSSRGAGLKNK